MYTIINTTQHAAHIHQLQTWCIEAWGAIDPLVDPQHRYPPPLLAIADADANADISAECPMLIGGLAFTCAPSPDAASAAVWVNAVIVHPEFRGHGIARSLIQAAASKVAEHDIDVLFVHTDIPDLYSKAGWSVVTSQDANSVLRLDIRGE